MYSIIKINLTVFLLFFSTLYSVSLNGQGIRVSGKVIDDIGAMPGVTVLMRGTMLGTVTNVNGEFSITVPGGFAVLQIIFKGYETQEFTVGDLEDGTITVTMIPVVREILTTVRPGFELHTDFTFWNEVTSASGGIILTANYRFNGIPALAIGIGYGYCHKSPLESAESANLFFVNGIFNILKSKKLSLFAISEYGNRINYNHGNIGDNSLFTASTTTQALYFGYGLGFQYSFGYRYALKTSIKTHSDALSNQVFSLGLIRHL